MLEVKPTSHRFVETALSISRKSSKILVDD